MFLLKPSRREWVTLASAAGFLAAGCGGGGGGGSTPSIPVTPTPTTVTVSGVAHDAAGAPAPGLGVRWDNSSSLTATAGGDGSFTLSIPVGQVTGNDSLTFTAADGSPVAITRVTVAAVGGSLTSLGSVTTYGSTPPLPPPP